MMTLTKLHVLLAADTGRSLGTAPLGGSRGRRGLLALFALFALAGTAAAQSQTVKAPISGGALDIGADLAGTPDPRAIEWPGKVWGNAGYSDTIIQFYPPPGYKVHIVSAVGTVSSFAHGVVPNGTTAGISWGLVSNVVTQTQNAFMNATCMAYVKQSITSHRDADTTPFSFTGIADNGTLASDNILVSRTAVYLNETGLSIHIEQALVLTYEFVPIVAGTAAVLQRQSQFRATTFDASIHSPNVFDVFANFAVASPRERKRTSAEQSQILLASTSFGALEK